MSLVSRDRILSIQGSMDLVPLMVGQSDVLSILGYLVFKDRVI